MTGATEAGKHTMGAFAVEIFGKHPPLTKLSLYHTGFKSSDLEEIRVALIKQNIKSLTYIKLRSNPALFDSDAKC